MRALASRGEAAGSGSSKAIFRPESAYVADDSFAFDDSLKVQAPLSLERKRVDSLSLSNSEEKARRTSPWGPRIVRMTMSFPLSFSVKENDSPFLQVERVRIGGAGVQSPLIRPSGFEAVCRLAVLPKRTGGDHQAGEEYRSHVFEV